MKLISCIKSALAMALTFGFLIPANAQELIQNGGFDPLSATSNGNNWGEDVSPWQFATIGSQNTVTSNHNIVSVDGPGGYNYGSLGPESDASNVGAGVDQYYLDSGNIPQLAWQYISPLCNGEARVSAMFATRENHGRDGPTVIGPDVPTAPGGPGHFFSTEGGLSLVAVTSTIPPFGLTYTTAGGQTVTDIANLDALHRNQSTRFLLGATQSQTASWEPVTMTVPVQAGQTYAFVADLGHSVNMDNASVVLECEDTTITPETSITKTCDPIPAGSQPPYTLDCQLAVTGSNLGSNDYVVIGDMFGGMTPVIGSISGSMMNITSTEPWNCVDDTLNVPHSIGFCELPATDLIAAGGTSVLDISFEFTTNNVEGQLLNCAMINNSDGPYIDASSNGQKMRPPKAILQQKSPSIPDGCVAINAPVAVDPILVVEKKCAEPEVAIVNGVQGYKWECHADVNVSPAPFNGVFNLIDDASNISSGTAEFLSSSVPCAGIGSNYLECNIDGNTMSSPYTVGYELFAVTTGTEPVEWENCVRGDMELNGIGITAPGNCVSTVLKPIPVKDPPPKELYVKKACTDPFATTHNGANGVGWNCEVTVGATPAPFVGTFSFVDNASNMTGGSNGNIIGIMHVNPAWNCLPGVPTQSTECTINGANFGQNGNPETISFEMFAEASEKPFEWENCVDGTYVDPYGKEQTIKGNCESMTWKPVKEPPEFSLKKQCSRPISYEDSQRYTCTIYISQTGGGPITSPLTLEELFQTTSGSPALQYLLLLQGTAGWNCAQPNFANGATCTIQPNDFNGVTGHQVSGTFLIPNDVLAKEDFVNCAELSLGDQTVASADCQPILEPPNDTTTFDVSKTCKAGERQHLSDTLWFQPYRCFISVTTNGVPFSNPIYVTDALSVGPNDGSQLINSIGSSDPWQCTSPQFGQGNQPACAIQGSQFPHSAGSSTITVDLVINAGIAAQGAENCANLQMLNPSTGALENIGQSCTTIFEEPEPSFDIQKTCEPATQSVAQQWVAQCLVTITGSNLPAGLQFRVTDELSGVSNATPVNGGFIPSPNVSTNCGGSNANGLMTSMCAFSTDQLNNGPISLPYTARFLTAGLLSPATGRNCVYAEIPGAGLYAPMPPGNKLCVDIPMVTQAVGGTGVLVPNLPSPAEPVLPDVTVGTGQVINPLVTSTPVPTPSIEKECDPINVIPGQQTADLTCRVRINSADLTMGKITIVKDEMTLLGSGTFVPLTTPFMNFVADQTTGIIWACSSNASQGNCYHDSSGLLAAAPVVENTLTTTIDLSRMDKVRGLENCVYLYEETGLTATTPLSSSCALIPFTYEGGRIPSAPNDQSNLEIIKEQVGTCDVDRGSQLYRCDYRISVQNKGSAPFTGSLAVNDTFGSPGVRSAKQTTGAGWTCGKPVGDAVFCTKPNANLPAGARDVFELSMAVKGQRKGGQFENCATLGAPTDRTQRVAMVQNIMNQRGLKAGPVDGKPGRQTYAALAKLKEQLGLPQTRDFDDALFAALGVSGSDQETSCVTTQLPPMPLPLLKCNPATTINKGTTCPCRFDNMVRRNATSCSCARGYDLVNGKGCVKRKIVAPKPKPKPAPAPKPKPTLSCEKGSTIKRGDSCVCIDQRNARKVSETQCRCKDKKSRMVAGRCIKIDIKPDEHHEGAAGNCKLIVNGICLKR